MADCHHTKPWVEVPLANGGVALVDEQDAELIAGYKWRWKGKPGQPKYAVAGRDGVAMHRLLMNAALGTKVDHFNGDGLDNRRENLRFCSHAENMRNSKLQSNNASGFKGVYFDKTNGRYRAEITANNQRRRLGRYDTAEEAHEAYCRMATVLHGEFARFE